MPRNGATKVFFTLAHALNLQGKQLDVTLAYLNGDSDETINMSQPKGFVDSNTPEWVCKLNKALYGLRQACGQWDIKLTPVILSLGFKTIDCCFFYINNGNETAFLVVHVDDILIAYNKDETINRTPSRLTDNFEINSRNTIELFFGIQIGRDTKRGHQP
jgi:hypothetical protein